MKIFKLISVLSAISLILSFTSCNKSKSNPESIASRDKSTTTNISSTSALSEKHYIPHKLIEKNDDILGYEFIKYTNDNIYICDYEESIENKFNIICTDLETKTSTTFTLKESVFSILGHCKSDNYLYLLTCNIHDDITTSYHLLKIDINSGEKLCDITLEENFGYHLLSNQYNSCIYVVNSDNITVYNENLEKINSISLNELIPKSEFGYSSQNDKQGNIYITSGYTLTKLSPDFTHLYTVSGFEDMINMPNISFDTNGKPALYSQNYDNNSIYINTLNESDGSVLEMYELYPQSYYALNACEECDYVFSDESQNICLALFDGTIQKKYNTNINFENYFFIDNKILYSFSPEYHYVGFNLLTVDNDGNVIEKQRTNEQCPILNRDGSYSLESSEINLSDKVTAITGENFYDIYCAFMYEDEIYYTRKTDEKVELCKISSDISKYITTFEDVSTENTTISHGDNSYDIYIMSNNNIYGYKIKNNTLSLLITNYNTLGIGAIHHITYNEQTGEYFCINELSEVYKLSPTEIIPNTQNINIALINTTDKTLTQKVSDYNNGNALYKIIVNNYNNYSDLNTDISTGKIPDIIISKNDFEIKKYAKQNLFADLTSFIENDDVISKEDFVGNTLNLYNETDKIYTIFPSFTLSTMISDKSLDTKNLTFNSFFEITDLYPEDTFYAISKDAIFKNFISHYLSEYTDTENSVCDFSNENFKKFITLINNQNCYETFEKLPTPISDGLCKFEIHNFYSPSQLSDDMNAQICGFPGKEKNHSYIIPNICLSITNNCTQKEEAWNFIKSYFTEDYQKTQLSGVFPVNTDVFNSNFDNSSLSKQMMDTILDAEPIYNYNTILQIISDEFSSTQTPFDESETIIPAIQSKVNLYLKEIS